MSKIVVFGDQATVLSNHLRIPSLDVTCLEICGVGLLMNFASK